MKALFDYTLFRANPESNRSHRHRGKAEFVHKLAARVALPVGKEPILLLCGFLFFWPCLTLAAGGGSSIKELDIVHFSHTDVGFTDHPDVCRDLYRRYLDITIDTALDTMHEPAERRFFWTAEATMPVYDWWQAATPARRKLFLKAVKAGQIEVTAMPFNNTPFMDAAQWNTMLHWLPEDLWQAVKPATAIQDDVNGLPRAGALALLDRGVRYLFTGINEDSGGLPFPRPAAFWWKMPDGRKLFVWLNIGYGSGFDFFEAGEWRRGPVPRAADPTYRPPRAGDILRTDEASLRKAHQICLQRLQDLEKSGYHYPLLTISITSQWRFDNDPPFPPLADFVAAWNKLGLEPHLRLTTASDAMRRMEKEMGASVPEHTGEWTDWWANGTASAPREVAASRAAKRFLAAAASPVWGPMSLQARKTTDDLYRDLCLFDEHTWGSSLSVAKPFSLDTLGQFNEKSRLAWRPMARAEWLLSQRARTKLVSEGEGLFVANPSPAPFSGWISFIASALRDNYRSVEDAKTGTRMKLFFEPGIAPWGRPQTSNDLSTEDVSGTFPDQAPNKLVRFWVERLEANSIKGLRLSTEEYTKPTESKAGLEIGADDSGWPKEIRWPGIRQPLFNEGLGQFSAVKVEGFAPRWILSDIRSQTGEQRDKMRREHLLEIAADAAEAASRVETPHTVVITQRLRHPRLAWAVRVLEIWKGQPRARLTLRLNRLPSAAPEIFYLDFPLPTGTTIPTLSNGGVPFTPFTDQLGDSCKDYFAIDGWADYATPDGHWLWVSRDTPLITLGADPTLARRQRAPQDVRRLRAMLLNNFWYTNFLADEPGIMEFQFDLVWSQNSSHPADAASALTVEPVVLINPVLKEDPRVLKDLFRP